MERTLIFDFDGVIHSYSSGWQGVKNIPDPPVPGIKEALAEIRASGFKVVVLSTRCHQEGGIQAIRAWLDKYGIVVDDVVRDKVPAMLTVDDNAICFDGDAGRLLDKIRDFKPWWKKRRN
jgi:hypothetical protein